MNEFLIKLVANSNNGGGNPYHDAEGKFTNGPSGAFGRFNSKEKPNKYTFDKIGFVSTGGKFESSLKKKDIDALVKINQALDKVYNLAADLEDEKGGVAYSNFYEMTSDINDRIKEFANASRPLRALRVNDVQRLISDTKRVEQKVNSITDRMKNMNDKDIADMSNATKAAINTFKYVQENNLSNISDSSNIKMTTYSIDDF